MMLAAAAIVLAIATPTPRLWEIPIPAGQTPLRPMHITPYHYRCIQKPDNKAIIVLDPIEEGVKPIGPIYCTNCICGGEK
jgi:hypothetical protein